LTRSLTGFRLSGNGCSPNPGGSDIGSPIALSIWCDTTRQERPAIAWKPVQEWLKDKGVDIIEADEEIAI
jgi:hypothetical protein